MAYNNTASPVYTAGLIVTHKCNLNCVYCYERNKSNRYMTLETAKELLLPLITEETDPLQIMLMGGEPLLAFPVIKALVEWVLENQSRWARKCFFFGSTNGTLLDVSMKEWFHQHRQVITLALSYDGLSEAQDENRSSSSRQIDLDFFRRNWPHQRVQMTVNERTVGRMAAGVIHLIELGFSVNASVAYEQKEWSNASLHLYLEQLLILMDYYLEHPSAPLIYQFCHPLEEYAKALNTPTVQQQQCGAGCGFVMFDDDGKSYPCHMLSSLVLSDEQLRTVQRLDLSSLSFQDPRCSNCPFSVACSTCAGSNYLYRGDVALRDETHCKIQQLEVDVCMRYNVSKMSLDPSFGSQELVESIKSLINI